MARFRVTAKVQLTEEIVVEAPNKEKAMAEAHRRVLEEGNSPAYINNVLATTPINSGDWTATKSPTKNKNNQENNMSFLTPQEIEVGLQAQAFLNILELIKINIRRPSTIRRTLLNCTYRIDCGAMMGEGMINFMSVCSLEAGSSSDAVSPFACAAFWYVAPEVIVQPSVVENSACNITIHVTTSNK